MEMQKAIQEFLLEGFWGDFRRILVIVLKLWVFRKDWNIFGFQKSRLWIDYEIEEPIYEKYGKLLIMDDHSFNSNSNN